MFVIWRVLVGPVYLKWEAHFATLFTSHAEVRSTLGNTARKQTSDCFVYFILVLTLVKQSFQRIL